MTNTDNVRISPHPKHDGLFIISIDGIEYIGTKNVDIGKDVTGERLFSQDGHEYREWIPYRSKLCAYLRKNGKEFHLKPDSIVLYLGAANGTTVSYISDIAYQGRIYAVEFSARSLRELVQRLEGRKNVIPILGDATRPYEYRVLVPEQVDVIYQDVAQPSQSKLLLDNAQMFLKKDGYFYIAIKARSIDVTKDPEEIFKLEQVMLQKHGCHILDSRDISPYSEDHVMIVGKI